MGYGSIFQGDDVTVKFAKERGWTRNAGLAVIGLTVISSLAFSNSRAFFTPQANLAAAVLPGEGQAGAGLADGMALAALTAPARAFAGNAAPGPRAAVAGSGLPGSMAGVGGAPSGAGAAAAAAIPADVFAAGPAGLGSPSGLGGGTPGTSTSPNVSTNPGLPPSQTPGAGPFQVTTPPTTPLPEPETWAMMIMGLGFVLVLLYRQRRGVAHA
ncbi:MAG: hypothetical protein B7Z20_12985 [Sphingobium sp. 32-64-5]|nr:MAG: hypothetical protein B7Z20_12985 [Sphingobium sp. 32-64-5]